MIATQPRPGGATFVRNICLALSTALLAAGCHARGTAPQLGAQLPMSEPVPARDASGAAGESSTSANSRRNSNAALVSADVGKTMVGVFGDSATLMTTLIDALPTVGPVWDMDVRSYEGQERVAFYVNLFTQSSRSRFQDKLRLSTRYEPMIRAKLRAGGIPEDMMYLAMVESGFDPNAYSSAAAVGMWQFMSSTARDVGLRVDWWVDERRDPAKSTDGAIRFLGDLQNQFGSLYLAAAAYNGGPGRVSRGLTRFAEEMEGTTGEDRFFALAEHDYLRSETKNYVPQIIAAALVGKDALRYGFSYDTLAAYSYDSIEVSAGTSLAAVATASGVGVDAIKELNPAVLRGMVPPTGALWIRVPLDGAVATSDIAAALAALPDQERSGYRTLKTVGTESASALASKAGVTAKQLAWYNPGLKSTKKGKLLANQSVRIPTIAVVAAATNVPDPSIERYGSSTVAATKSGSVHIVQRGESLGRIASRYKTSVARLKTLNGLRSDKVLAGQAIRVRATTTTVSRPAAPAKPASKSPAKAASKAPTKSPSKSASKVAVKAPAKSVSKAPVKSSAKAPSKSAARSQSTAKSTSTKSTSTKPAAAKTTSKKTASTPAAVKKSGP